MNQDYNNFNQNSLNQQSNNELLSNQTNSTNNNPNLNGNILNSQSVNNNTNFNNIYNHQQSNANMYQQHVNQMNSQINSNYQQTAPQSIQNPNNNFNNQSINNKQKKNNVILIVAIIALIIIIAIVIILIANKNNNKDKNSNNNSIPSGVSYEYSALFNDSLILNGNVCIHNSEKLKPITISYDRVYLEYTDDDSNFYNVRVNERDSFDDAIFYNYISMDNVLEQKNINNSEVEMISKNNDKVDDYLGQGISVNFCTYDYKNNDKVISISGLLCDINSENPYAELEKIKEYLTQNINACIDIKEKIKYTKFLDEYYLKDVEKASAFSKNSFDLLDSKYSITVFTDNNTDIDRDYSNHRGVDNLEFSWDYVDYYETYVVVTNKNNNQKLYMDVRDREIKSSPTIDNVVREFNQFFVK